MLFDEVEKASDALWNLLLGILDKATLTLGDNRRVDFSRALIFMTSNLGAAEMDAIRRPRFGFAASELEKLYDTSDGAGVNSARISEAGLDAVRRRFNPEFLNRLDKIVVFNPLGEVELRAILEIELRRLQQQILNSSPAAPFAIALTEAAKSHLLVEGTDTRYGARPLKRAIDCSLVRPLSNLIATRQVREGDWIAVDFDECARQMVFTKEGEDLPTYVMSQLSEAPGTVPAGLVDAAGTESPALAARGNRKGTPFRGRNVAA